MIPREFVHGLTVRELKEMMEDWPEENEYGDPYEVWIETDRGRTNVVIFVSPLNKCEDGADILLESAAFK